MATINPFQGPINYSVDVQSPFEAALGGFKIGAAGAEIQAQQQAQQKAKTYQTGIDAFFAKPADQRTYSDIEPLLVGANKQQFDALQAVAKGMGEQKLDSSKRFTGQLLVALEQNPETAKTLLNQRIEVETDPQQKLAWQDTLKTIDISPVKAANTIELLGAATFGKDWYESITQVRGERRTAAEAPSKLAKSVADASKAVADSDKAVADATTAQATAKNAPEKAKADAAKATADAAKAKADAQKAEVDAKYAEQAAQDAVKKRLADLNLTKAQTTKFNVETGNLSTTGQLLKLDFDAAVKGLPLPSKNAGTTVGTASEDERKAAGWLSQADNAYKNMLSAMYTKEGKRTGAEEVGFAEALPFVGGGGATRGPERQKFVQAGASLSEALLRAATGAGQNENEAKQKIEELTPTFFDEPDTIKQKLAAIPMYLQSLQARAGRAAPKDYTVPSVPGVFVTTPNGQTIRFDNQNAADAFKKAAGIQ
jgi:hypothetical protein